MIAVLQNYSLLTKRTKKKIPIIRRNLHVCGVYDYIECVHFLIANHRFGSLQNVITKLYPVIRWLSDFFFVAPLTLFYFYFGLVIGKVVRHAKSSRSKDIGE